MRALILCAGEGTRLRPLTHKIAKPAVPLLNIPMWSYPLGLIESLGITDLHVNTHHLPESIQKSFKRHARANYFIHFHHEETLLGSALPLLHFKKEAYGTSEPFLIANGDGVMITRNQSVLIEMHRQHINSKALATILAIPMKGAGSEFSGVWVGSGGNYVGVGKAPPQPNARPLHYASIMIFSPDVYRYISKDSKNIFLDVLDAAAAKRERIQVFTSKDLQFFETGNLKDLSQAHKSLLQILQKNESQWNLIDLMDRFQPGWRNYQRHLVYRNQRLDGIRFENEGEHLTLLAPGPQPIEVDQVQKVRVKGPSTVYRWQQTLPESLDGCYWGDLKMALLNSGQLIEL